jgi:hypothetical protein
VGAVELLAEGGLPLGGPAAGLDHGGPRGEFVAGGVGVAVLLRHAAGTLLGALLAIVLVLALPRNLLLLAAINCLIALAAYAMSANYFMQTVFPAPMLLLFMTSGDEAEATLKLTLGRVFYTLIGAALVARIAEGMNSWDEHSRTRDAGPEPPVH